MEKGIYKGLCVMLIVLLIVTTVSYVYTGSVSFAKVYNGPKDVYPTAKDKPPGTPGGGKPEKPPKDPKPEPDPSIDKWAVVIGISNYRGKQNDLLYCDDDAVDMYDYLLSRGYPEGNIRLLLDGAAKAEAIMKAIDWLSSWEGEDSEVVFFYSGHGSTYDGYDDGDGEYTDEAIVSADLYLILDGQLTQQFADFNSQKISFTFDSCFSGGMDDLSSSGRVVVTGCGETQYTYDGTSAQQNGVFTYYYVDGLNEYHTVQGAYGHAAPLAKDFIAENYGANMDPQIYDQYDKDWGF